MFGSLGAPELLIILAIVVVLFGASRLSGLGKGGAARPGEGDSVRKELREGQEEDEAAKKTATTVGTATTPRSSGDKPSQMH